MAELDTQINRKLIVAAITAFTVVGLNLCTPRYGKSTEFQRETAVVRAVRRVSPAVVNISSEYEIRKRRSPFSGFGTRQKIENLP